MKTLRELYQSYLNNRLNQPDLQAFLTGVDDKKNEEEMHQLMDETWQEMYGEEARVIPMKPRRKVWKMAAAAAIILAIGGYIISQQKPKEPTAEIKQQEILPGREGAILTLENGKQIVLDSMGNGNIANVATKQGNQLVYEGSAEVQWNTMTTPRGRQFQLQLADGSRLWLNASSQVRFPTAFTGKERRIEVKGEAYLEVAPKANQPFYVSVNNTEIKVLGTSFNVNSYEDEEAMVVTLVSGKVKVSRDDDEVTLKPGEAAIELALPAEAPQERRRAGLQRLESIDVNAATSWMRGNFTFRSTPLKTVMRQLSRWYDVDVQYAGGQPQQSFTGRLDRSLKLTEVLKILEQTGVNFKIEGRKLIIQP